MMLTARILLGLCYKFLRDCANKFTEIELVLCTTAECLWDCTFRVIITSNDSRVSCPSIAGSKVVS